MPKKKSKEPEARDSVSVDIVYQEMYGEMRRYRDYELASSNWYTAILLALAGAIITFKYSDVESSISILLSQSSILKFSLSFLAFFLITSSAFTALYASSRYSHMRDWVNDNLEPAWKSYRPSHRRLRPIHAIISVQIILAIIIITTLWFP